MFDGANLIQCDETGAALKTTRDPPGVGAASGGHRCDDGGAQVAVQLLRRHDQAGPRLPDFTADRRIEDHEMDVATRDRAAAYHSHS